MKKIFALLLAIVMVMGLATVASATDADDLTPTEEKTFNFQKSYVTSENGTPATYPAEILKFDIKNTVVPEGVTKDSKMITIEDQTIDANPDTLIVKIPSYSEVGKYEYTITEVKGATQGVDYDTTTVIGVQVLVSYNDDHTALVSQVVFNKKVDGTTTNEKVDEIVNTYDLGALTVQKVVDGNLADTTDQFDITVTFTSDKIVKSDITCTGAEVTDGTIDFDADWTEANGSWTWTETFTLSHGGKVNFTNIPAGVEWSIVEADYTGGDKNNKNEGYNAPIYDNYQNGTVAAGQDVTSTIKNVKETKVDTGIVMDSVPFVVMAVIAVLGLAAFTAKKRVQE